MVICNPFQLMMRIENITFTCVTNVYLTHNFLENQLMCEYLWKYVDIERVQNAFPKHEL